MANIKADYKDKSTKAVGRPKGSGYKQVLFDKIIKPRAEAIAEKIYSEAMNGDSVLLKFLGERVLPKNPIGERLVITQNVLEQVQHIMEYCVNGHISPDDAIKLVSIVKEKVNIGKVADLEEQLQSIESWIKEREIGGTNVTTYQGVLQNGEELDSESNKEQRCTTQSIRCEAGEEDTASEN
jgi:hypothetical protein